jgi:muconate cycloisomerase
MKITSLRLHPVAVARQYATVIAKEGGNAKQAVAKSYFYFVEARTDSGLIGWGEISDIESGDLPQDHIDYGQLLAAFMRGRDPFAVQQMHRDFTEHFLVDESSLAKYSRCALDMAMYDLQGKATRQPIYNLLGGKVRNEVVISWVAYIREELDLLRAEMREKVAQGFRAFKLKVGVDIDLDEERVALAREIGGKDASIKVDANAGWSVADAPRNIRRLNRYRLAGVETPVPREDPADIAAVRKQVDVPILEHVSSLEYGLALAKAEAVDVFNVATTGAGGIWPARQIVSLAEAAGIGVLLGSTVELGPGTLAQLHLAAITPNLTLPSDLIGPGMYTKHVLVEPLEYEQGKLRVPSGNGLGGEVDTKQFAELPF